MNPLVSVIIPVYNVYDYLEKCVESVKAQTYTNLEIILVDDGSPDNSGALCDVLAASDDRIRVIHKENGGLSSARNAGLETFTGSYLLFVDSDDFIDFDLVNRCLDVITEHRCDMVIFNHIRESGESVSSPIRCEEKLYITDKPFLKRRNLLFHQTNYSEYGWTATNRFLSGDFVRKYHLRFPDNRIVFSEDLAFALKCALYTNSFYCISDTLYHYVIRENSITSVQKRFPAAKYLKLFDFFEAELAQAGTCTLSKKDIYYVETKLLSGVLNKPDWSYKALAESCFEESQEIIDFCIKRFSRTAIRLAVNDMGLLQGLSFTASHRLVARMLEGKSYKWSFNYIYISLVRKLRKLR